MDSRTEAATIALLVAGVVTAGVSPWVIGLLQRLSIVDHENGRTSHHGVVPRGGGLSILIGLLVALTITSGDWIDQRPLALAATVALAFGLLGLIDDFRTLPALLRLVTQALLTCLFLAFADLGLLGVATIVGLPLAAMWILGFVNAFNFMDGINGISSFTTIIVGSSLVLASWRWDSDVELPALALVGAAIGFAPFNALKGRIFLGDVGSYLLGSGLALLALIAIENDVPVLPVMLPFLLYVGDVSYTMYRRARLGEPLLKSHRQHVYQRLTNGAGWSHLRTSGIVSAFTLVLVAIGQLAAEAPIASQLVLSVIAVGFVVVYLSLPRLVATQPTPATRRETAF